jgi:lipoate-protein ligase A
MSSEVETSRGNTLTQCDRIPRVRSAALGMTNAVFTELQIYCDDASHSAAMNMAIDEALLEYVESPAIRFYRWQSPALSFGYFGRFADVADYQRDRDLVRRWTGGGIVFHGEDITYSIVIPVGDPAFCESSMAIYERIHRALCDALKKNGQPAVVAAGADRGKVTSINDRAYSCFTNPVRSDVMIGGRKIAGAAQRRTRRGLLQQGSIQGIDLENNLAQRFARELATVHREQKLTDEILNQARELSEQKYGTEDWLRKH